MSDQSTQPPTQVNVGMDEHDVDLFTELFEHGYAAQRKQLFEGYRSELSQMTSEDFEDYMALTMNYSTLVEQLDDLKRETMTQLGQD